MLRRPELALLGPYSFEQTRPKARDPLARWTAVFPRPQLLLLDVSTAPKDHRIRDILGETLLFRELDRPQACGQHLICRGVLYTLSKCNEMGEIYEPVMLPEGVLKDLWGDLVELGATSWELSFVDVGSAGDSLLTLIRPIDSFVSRMQGAAGFTASCPAQGVQPAPVAASPLVQVPQARSKRPARAEVLYRQYWTAEEDARLVQLKGRGKNVEDIARDMHRTERAVRSRWERLQATNSRRKTRLPASVLKS